jgi:hypothetical protein
MFMSSKANGFHASARRSNLLGKAVPRARLVCVLFLVVSIGWVAALSATDEISAFNKLPPWVAVFGFGGVLCVIGTVLVVMNAVKSCRVPGRWFWSKLHDVALALACLGLVWFLIAWKLMNFNLNF